MLGCLNVPNITCDSPGWGEYLGRWGEIAKHDYSSIATFLATFMSPEDAAAAVEALKEKIGYDEALGETGPTGPKQKSVWDGTND
jgi:hypothetical protein